MPVKMRRTLTREKPPWRAIRSSSKGMCFAEVQARFGTEGPDLSRSPSALMISQLDPILPWRSGYNWEFSAILQSALMRHHESVPLADQ